VSKVARDITERKRVDRRRGSASEASYRTLFDYAPDGIVIADSQSFYLDANASMCRMLGYTREELIGLNASDIVAKKEIQHIGPALSEIKASPIIIVSGNSGARMVPFSTRKSSRPRCPTAICWA
jgi:PAS domain-containing protein